MSECQSKFLQISMELSFVNRISTQTKKQDGLNLNPWQGFSLSVVASAVGAHLMCLLKFTTFLFHKCVMVLIFMSQPCYKPFYMRTFKVSNFNFRQIATTTLIKVLVMLLIHIFCVF